MTVKMRSRSPKSNHFFPPLPIKCLCKFGQNSLIGSGDKSADNERCGLLRDPHQKQYVPLPLQLGEHTEPGISAFSDFLGFKGSPFQNLLCICYPLWGKFVLTYHKMVSFGADRHKQTKCRPKSECSSEQDLHRLAFLLHLLDTTLYAKNHLIQI